MNINGMWFYIKKDTQIDINLQSLFLFNKYKNNFEKNVFQKNFYKFS